MESADGEASTVEDGATDSTDSQEDGLTLQTFTEEDATDGSETQIGGIPYIPQVPTEEEEAEPYDCAPNPATCTGATAPEFALFDFQPQSCGFQATYGLDLYKNHVTLVALLAAW